MLGNTPDEALLREWRLNRGGTLCLGWKFRDDAQPRVQGVLVEHMLRSDMHTICVAHMLTHTCACAVHTEVCDPTPHAALKP